MISLFSLPALAQDVPQFEVFGGYSLLNLGGTGKDYGQGFIGAVEGNVTGWFGIVGEFGFYDFEMGSSYYYMGGPRFSYRTDHVRTFGHFLFGGINAKDDNGSISDTEFGWGFGGGIDIAVNDIIAIRPAQFDVISVHTNTGFHVDGRYSGGVVFTFGSK